MQRAMYPARSRSSPAICTSIVSASPDTALCHFCGTRPRLANSSTTRGIIPGSARAWTEKQTEREEPSLSASAAAAKGIGDDIAKILSELETNQHGPSPSEARVGNSPLAGA